MITFNFALESLLKMFGGTTYQKMTIDAMKNQVYEVLKKVKTDSPAEKAVITKFRTKITSSKTKEKLLMTISEQMFSLSGESV